MIDTLSALVDWVATQLDARVFSQGGFRNYGVPLGILALTVALEVAARRNWRVRYGSRNFRVDLFYYLFYYSGAYHFLVFAWLYNGLTGVVTEYAPWLQMNLLGGMPPWAQIIVLILAADLFGYWSHRLRHASGTLWVFHAIHHAQTVLTVPTNYRFHIVDETVLRLCLFLPFQMLGTGIEMWLALDLAMAWVLLLQHSEWNWTYGRLGYVLVSPVFHRKHHSTDERLQNCNYGMLLTIWDDLFGTADRKTPCPTTHGLVGNPVPETLWGQLVYPFAELHRQWRVRRVAPAPAAAVASTVDE
jgi:sterol desaturase/sphingolipid hydroxylase (fatty acid hydroxylase superfamily)